MFKTNHKKTALVFMISIVFLFNSSSGFAAINLENRTGTVILTTPSNESQTIEPEQTLPPIESGSSIQVLTGSADCTLSDGDFVTIQINNGKVNLRDKAKVEVSTDRTGVGILTVIEGTAEVVREDLTTQTLTAGQSFVLEPMMVPLPPGTDPVENVGRQTDTELGKVGGY